MSDNQVTQWLQALSQGDFLERKQALMAASNYLKQHAHPQLMMALVSHALIETDGSLTVLCVQSLGKLKIYSAVDVLVSVMLAQVGVAAFQDKRMQGDGSLTLRQSAIQALGQIGDPRVIPKLMKILNNKRENYRLRLAAAESLGKLGDPNATRPLVDVLMDDRESSLYLRESAAKALGLLGDIRALEALIDVLESKRGFRDKFNFLKEHVIEAIGNIGKRSHRVLDNLYMALEDEAPSIRLAAVQAIERLGDESALVQLQRLLFDPEDDIGIAVVSALYSIGGERAIQLALMDENLPQFIREELESYLP